MNSYCRFHVFAVKYCQRWLHSSLQRPNVRSPLIHFPVRRKPNGDPLVSLSLEAYRSQQVQTGSNRSASFQLQESRDLPASYGRKAISENEMEAINLGYSRY